MKPTDVALAYDAIAQSYDEQVRGDEWIRRLLWQHFRRTFRSGEWILDVACGTGVDAVFLAGLGMRVVGIDVSPAMIAQLQTRAAGQQLADGIESQVLDYSHLSSLPADSFDGIISSFAGLNTAADLEPFARGAARLLRPGGRMVLHLLGRFSLWEWLGLLAHREWRSASELSRRKERVFRIGDQPVCHYLFDPDEIYYRFFAKSFCLHQMYSLGCLCPPHDLRRVPRRLASALGRVERRVSSHRPFVNWGRFYVLELRRKDEPDVRGIGGQQ